MDDDVMAVDEPWWDDFAPYGRYGYSYGRGEEVPDWRVVRSVQFVTSRSTVVSMSGVAELADGRVYRLSIRRPNYELLNGRRRVAHRDFRSTFEELARVMWMNEQRFVDPGLVDHYQAQIDAL